MPNKDIDQPNQKRVMFRYEQDDHPDLDDWLNAQTNKTQSVIAALTVIANKYGKDQDFIQGVMQETIKL